uniref:Enkurin domain-containing protein n=1 Tax=Schistosoma haematobium TaxID=6185 RepID=A0A095A118_SCHHA
MTSILSHHPVFVNNYTNLYKPNLINHNLKSTDETNFKCTNGPTYNVDLLQWQTNTSSSSLDRLRLRNNRRKDYIRENIRQLRQLEDSITFKKRVAEQCGRSVLSTDRTQNNTCNKFITCHHAQTRQSQPNENPISSESLSKTDAIKSSKQNKYSINLNKTDNPKYLQSNNSSISTQTDNYIDQLKQTIPPHMPNSHNVSSKNKGQSHQSLSLRTNKSDKKIQRTTLTPIQSIKKTEYLRAHSRDIEDEVEFIRRDINFVRANAHMATAPSVKRTGIRRIASLNSLSLNDKTHLTDSNITKSQISHTSRMWPERRLKSGVIPPYLIKMKQKEKERIQKELENQPDPDQPPGHQRMPEEERLNTLELLNKGINS